MLFFALKAISLVLSPEIIFTLEKITLLTIFQWKLYYSDLALNWIYSSWTSGYDK